MVESDTFEDPPGLMPHIGTPKKPDMVNHPAHYGGADNPYETDKVCVAWGLDKDAYLYNVVKYVSRAGKKGDALEDLQKARWYLNRRIEQMEKSWELFVDKKE